MVNFNRKNGWWLSNSINTFVLMQYHWNEITLEFFIKILSIVSHPSGLFRPYCRKAFDTWERKNFETHYKIRIESWFMSRTTFTIPSSKVRLLLENHVKNRANYTHWILSIKLSIVWFFWSLKMVIFLQNWIIPKIFPIRLRSEKKK